MNKNHTFSLTFAFLLSSRSTLGTSAYWENISEKHIRNLKSIHKCAFPGLPSKSFCSVFDKKKNFRSFVFLNFNFQYDMVSVNVVPALFQAGLK